MAKILRPVPGTAKSVFQALERIDVGVRNDPRNRQSIVDWKKCMGDAGYKYESPVEPMIEFGRRSELASDEIEVANIDVECKIRVNYIGRRIAIESAYQKREIDDNPEAWREFKKWKDARSSAAAGVIARNN